MRRLAHFFDDPIELFAELREGWGDIVGLRSGPLRMIVCHDLDVLERILIREPKAFLKGDGLRATRYVLGNGLINANGEEHRRNRKLAAPMFTPRTIEPFADAMAQITMQELELWPQAGTVGMTRAAFDISLRIAGVGLFGTDFSRAERDLLCAATSELTSGYRTLVAPGGTTLVRSGLTPHARRIRRARGDVDRIIRGLVTQRRAEDSVREVRDLLTLLLNARDEAGGGFSDEQLRDEAVTMLLAGHDTTAATLTWALALLALHPHEQVLARAEVDAVVGAGRLPGAADLRSLPRLRAVVEETLRLHPTIYSTPRDPIEPMELDGGIVLRPGADVLVPIAGILRDPRHWPEPDQYRPSRFLDEDARRARHRLAYMPFGAGPRICIGSSFATQQLLIVLATILQRCELEAPEGYALRATVDFFRRPEGPVPLHVRRRV